MTSLSFKSFVITEAARAKHTLKFFDYEQNEHSDIAKKIRSDLEKAWTKIATKIPKAEVSDIDMSDNKYSDIIEFSAKEATVGRFGNKSSVAPSVKIGGAYDKSIKNECKKDLMYEAHKILTKYKDLLNRDVPGEPFAVSQEDGPMGEIRLKFKTGEYTKAIFMVAIEPGYKFERVYLKDYLDK
jgi:hypothetical protein